MKKLFAILLCFFTITFQGCSTLQTDTAFGATESGAVATGTGLRGFKRAYIEILPEDEFQLYRALFSELNDMGIEVVGLPFKEPTDSDLVVRYNYDSGWDLTRYLQSFQFQFINAKTSKVVAMTSFKSRGLWLGVRDGRLETAFNDLRAKNGYPPTKQFSK